MVVDQFVGSYTASGTSQEEDSDGNMENVKLAHSLDMGVFCISPNDKGGMMYKPSKVDRCVVLFGVFLSRMTCKPSLSVECSELGCTFHAPQLCMTRLRQRKARCQTCVGHGWHSCAELNHCVLASSWCGCGALFVQVLVDACAESGITPIEFHSLWQWTRQPIAHTFVSPQSVIPRKSSFNADSTLSHGRITRNFARSIVQYDRDTLKYCRSCITTSGAPPNDSSRSSNHRSKSAAVVDHWQRELGI